MEQIWYTVRPRNKKLELSMSIGMCLGASEAHICQYKHNTTEKRLFYAPPVAKRPSKRGAVDIMINCDHIQYISVLVNSFSGSDLLIYWY